MIIAVVPLVLALPERPDLLLQRLQHLVLPVQPCLLVSGHERNEVALVIQVIDIAALVYIVKCRTGLCASLLAPTLEVTALHGCRSLHMNRANTSLAHPGFI